MKSLEQIKDEVAKKFGYKDWITIYNLDEVSNAVIDAIAKEYAREALREAVKKVFISYLDCGDPKTCGCGGICERKIAIVNKDSILSIINKLK